MAGLAVWPHPYCRMLCTRFLTPRPGQGLAGNDPKLPDGFLGSGRSWLNLAKGRVHAFRPLKYGLVTRNEEHGGCASSQDMQRPCHFNL